MTTHIEIAREFLKAFKKSVIQACIKFTIEHGPGMLVINLEKQPNNLEELDVEYWTKEQLPNDLKQKLTNTHNSIYYCLSFPNTSLFYEERLKR